MDVRGIIREARRSQGLSAYALSIKLNRGENYIGQIEGGTREPSLSGLEEILSALGLSLSVSPIDSDSRYTSEEATA